MSKVKADTNLDARYSWACAQPRANRATIGPLPAALTCAVDSDHQWPGTVTIDVSRDHDDKESLAFTFTPIECPLCAEEDRVRHAAQP